jgi:FkbM family methyltransferase
MPSSLRESMSHYRRNKFRTAWAIVRDIENWATALDMRLRRHRRGLRMLNFRNGLTIVCHGGTGDWDVIHELMFAGSYARALEYLRSLPGCPLVLDFGGNIGLFSLLAARAHPRAEVHAYEPGPPNWQLFEMNRLANPGVADRIHLCKEAVAGRTRQAEWFFNSSNPGGSGFTAGGGWSVPVQVRAFAEIAGSLQSIDLMKIDIEGTEFELLSSTPPDVWDRVRAISLELHQDPSGQISQMTFLERLKTYGFEVEEEAVCSFFLHRAFSAPRTGQ